MGAPLYREATSYAKAPTRQISRAAEAANNSVDAAEVKRGARLGYAITLRQLYAMIKPARGRPRSQTACRT